MSSQLPPLPEQVRDEWEKYSLEELREESQNLRRYVAQLFMQVKEWTSRMNDLAAASEQLLKLRGDDESKYIALSNKTNFLTDQNTELSNKVSHLLREMDTSHYLISNHTLHLTELNENITLIMQAIGLTEEENNNAD